MKKILLIGATGGTGKQILAQALEKGYYVTALVRNSKKQKLTHSNLNVIEGDVLKPESLTTVMHGQDVVISSLGHKHFFGASSILSKGTENVMAAMNKAGIKRFICITALGINDSRFKLGLYYTLFTKLLILPFYFHDKAKQEKLISQSNLDWTIVRPGQLFNGKKRENYLHGEGLGSYILTKMISRADVAHFILKELEENRYVKKKPALVYKNLFFE